MSPLTLDPRDPTVVQAKASETALYDHYGIKGVDRHVRLPALGIEVRVTEFGSGDPIVIVPGNTGDAFPLAGLMARLTGRRIIAINRPGGGLSEGMDHRTVAMPQFAVETLDTLFDALHLQNADIVAHSMGAHWSTLFAMARPQRVRRLVLLGNPGAIMGGKPPFVVRLMGVPPFGRWLASLAMPRKRDQALRPLEGMGHSRAALARQPRQLADAYFDFRKLPHYLLSATSMMENPMPALEAADLRPLLQPTALLLGTADNFASQELGQRIVQAMPAGVFHAIANAGHLPWLEAPGECAGLILDFLQPEEK